jgi:RND family efflux transporter MFP subunit
MKYEAAAKIREQELNLKKSELALEQARKKIESQKIINDADLSKARLKVKQARMRLEQEHRELEALTLTAPRSGLVVLQEIWSPNGRAKVKIGDTPWRGMSLVEIPDLSEMMVMVNVNEVDINQVVEGQQAIIKVDALPNKTFYGIVSRVSSLASRERGSDVKNFKVEITIAGADPELRPGMTAQCQIITDRIQDQLYIPLESVFQEEDTTVVYIKKSGFEKRIVQLGPRNSDYVVVKAGLEAEDNVSLFNPTKPLQDLGKEIQPMEENNKKSNKNDEPEMLIIG